MTHDIARLTSAPFAPALDQEVMMAAADGRTVTATLTKVEELPRFTPPDAPRPSFHLIFKAAEPCPFGSGDYSLIHEAWGSLGPVHVERVFPGAATSPFAYFEVVFN